MTPSFYKKMGYPIPFKKDLFLHISEIDFSFNKKEKEKQWDSENKLLKEYITYINKYENIWNSLPFIRQIYLCNSITFNALHEKSDIDIFIITKRNYLWLARFFSVIILFAAGLKRDNKNIAKKFCLSFYTEEGYGNLYPLRQAEGDQYLSYRVAHCVLLYTDNYLKENYIWESNKELLDFLPFHPKKQVIDIKNKIIRGNSLYKQMLEKLLNNKIGKIIQYCIKKLRTIIIIIKKRKLSPNYQKSIIINNNMLKFHQDKRPIYQFKQRKNKG